MNRRQYWIVWILINMSFCVYVVRSVSGPSSRTHITLPMFSLSYLLRSRLCLFPELTPPSPSSAWQEASVLLFRWFWVHFWGVCCDLCTVSSKELQILTQGSPMPSLGISFKFVHSSIFIFPQLWTKLTCSHFSRVTGNVVNYCLYDKG